MDTLYRARKAVRLASRGLRLAAKDVVGLEQDQRLAESTARPLESIGRMVATSHAPGRGELGGER